MLETLHFTLNGNPISIPALPDEKLSHLLRERLFLTGTKVSCGEGKCGACTVLLDGKPVRSCITKAEKVAGKSVLTIEGLSQIIDGSLKLHPLQEAFVKHGAIQCGFCTPGQVMRAYALLEKNPHPTRSDIRRAMRGNLCRCASYPCIENAILAAAEAMHTNIPLYNPVIPLSKQPLHVIGKAVERPDAVDKVTGKPIYTDDLHFEGMLFARVKRAEIPHAILQSIDMSEAKAIPGVVAVLTAEDIPGSHNHGLIAKDWPIMVGVGEHVRYEGDALAIVAAETQEIANQAAEHIEVNFDPLPVVSDPVQAIQKDSPQLHKQGNLLKHIKVRKGDLETGFAEADIVLEHTFRTPIMEHLFMEPECSIAVPSADGRMTIFVGSQIPYADREQVADALGWKHERIHIAGSAMGGGFGGKEDISGQIHAALLAHATGRPVKLLFDRSESLLVHPKRHAAQVRVKVGAKKDGSLTAVQTELYGDTGAYASLGEKVMTRATTHSAGPYVIPHTRADCFAMHTNNPPAGAFRGFGVMQSAFAVESMMDMLAETLQIDPITLRRMNALRVGSHTNTGQEFTESVGLLACIDAVQEKLYALAGPEPFKPVIKKTDKGNVISAWGFAVAFKNTGLGGSMPDQSGAEVELFTDGTLQVRTSAAELGQGLVTVLRMIVAEEFSISIDKVRVLVMDTDRTPDGGPTTASRQTYVTGNAAKHAAFKLQEEIRRYLQAVHAEDPESIRFADGFVIGEDLRKALGDIAQEMQTQGYTTSAKVTYTAPKTHDLKESGNIHFAYSFACQAAQVEVNPESGEVRVLRVICANDVGKAINPMGLKGQVEGGIIMGIGHTLMEEFIVENGHIQTRRLSDYPIPTIQDTPEIIAMVVEAPTSEGPYGAKGVGEIVSIPTTPAITNAIYHAVGVRIDHLPVRKSDICQKHNCE